MTFYIYTLSCPVSGLVKYVGKTNNLQLRYNGHVSDHRKMSKIKSWLLHIKREGLKPVMEVIDTCQDEEWRFWESYWICQFRAWGFSLKNSIDGGLGISRVSEEMKAKISLSLTGKPLTWDVNARLGKKIRQYDLDGNYLRSFDSLSDAEKLFSYKTSNVISAIRRRQSAYGFQWRYLSNECENPIEKYIRTPSKPHLASLARNREVIEVDEHGNELQRYSSLKIAEKHTGLHNISAVCRGIRESTQGRIFKYAIESLAHNAILTEKLK